MGAKGNKPKLSQSMSTRSILRRRPVQPPLENSKQLIEAIKWGDLERFHSLLSQNVDLNYCDEEGNTPLLTAIFMNNYPIVKRLLEKGADVGPSANNNPICLAGLMENKKIIALLEEYIRKKENRVQNKSGPCRIKISRECPCADCQVLRRESKLDKAVISKADWDKDKRVLAQTPAQVLERRQHDQMSSRFFYLGSEKFVLDAGSLEIDTDPKDIMAFFDALMKDTNLKN